MTGLERLLEGSLEYVMYFPDMPIMLSFLFYPDMSEVRVKSHAFREIQAVADYEEFLTTILDGAESFFSEFSNRVTDGNYRETLKGELERAIRIRLELGLNKAE